MKMLFLVYDVDYDEEVMQTLTSCCLTGYTKWTRVLGKGVRSDPKLDDAVWPGFNCVIMLAVEDKIEQDIYDALQSLHKKVNEKALKVFSWGLDRVI